LLDGDSRFLEKFFIDYRESEFSKAIVGASIHVCGGDMPFLRLMIVNAFFNSIPNFHEFWKILNFQSDADATGDVPQKILSIIYPKVDWAQVADLCRKSS
jgi:hypothetical protein